MEWYWWLTIYLAVGLFMGIIYAIGEISLYGWYLKEELGDALGILFGFIVGGGIMFFVGCVVAFVFGILTLLDKIDGWQLRWQLLRWSMFSWRKL